MDNDVFARSVPPQKYLAGVVWTIPWTLRSGPGSGSPGFPCTDELSEHRWDVGAGSPGKREGPVLVWTGDGGGWGVPASCEGGLGSDVGRAGSHRAAGKEVVMLDRTGWSCWAGASQMANSCPGKCLHQGWEAEDAACKGRGGDHFLNSSTMPLTADSFQ